MQKINDFLGAKPLRHLTNGSYTPDATVISCNFCILHTPWSTRKAYHLATHSRTPGLPTCHDSLDTDILPTIRLVAHTNTHCAYKKIHPYLTWSFFCISDLTSFGYCFIINKPNISMLSAGHFFFLYLIQVQALLRGIFIHFHRMSNPIFFCLPYKYF